MFLINAKKKYLSGDVIFQNRVLISNIVGSYRHNMKTIKFNIFARASNQPTIRIHWYLLPVTWWTDSWYVIVQIIIKLKQVSSLLNLLSVSYSLSDLLRTQRLRQLHYDDFDFILQVSLWLFRLACRGGEQSQKFWRLGGTKCRFRGYKWYHKLSLLLPVKLFIFWCDIT